MTASPPVRVAAVAAPFGRDLEACFAAVAELIGQARAAGVRLLVLPEAALGGYLADLADIGDRAELSEQDLAAETDAGLLPPALDPDGPEITRLAELAGDMVVCAGYCERSGPGPADRYNSAVCVTGDGVLGRHRKVHQPLGEPGAYRAGDRFAAFDTPAGRLGMMICYDKAFPEAGRELALGGAEIVACLSAWPAGRTAPAEDIEKDRWTQRFDLFDRVRALENQVLWVASNQTGTFGTLRFVGHAKVVDPGGEVLAATTVAPGMAVADVELPGALETARRAMFHLRDRRVEAYGIAIGSGA